MLLVTLQIQKALLRSTGPGHAGGGPEKDERAAEPGPMHTSRLLAAFSRPVEGHFLSARCTSVSSSLCDCRGVMWAKGPLRRCPEDAKALWRAEPGAGPTLPRALCVPSVTGPDTLVGKALPGRLLSFIQGPLARSVPGGSCCQLPCAGTTKTALPAPWRPRSLQPTGPAHGLVRRVLGWACGRGRVTSNQDHLSCVTAFLVARQSVVPLGPPKPGAPENPRQLGGAVPSEGRGLAEPGG